MKIVVRADSWHYKVWKLAQDPFVVIDRWIPPSASQLENRAKEPTALCGYFWTIVLAPLMVPVALLATGIVIGGVMGVAGAVIGVAWLLKQGATRSWRSLRRREKIARPASLAASYAAARKQSICPLIEVER